MKKCCFFCLCSHSLVNVLWCLELLTCCITTGSTELQLQTATLTLRQDTMINLGIHSPFHNCNLSRSRGSKATTNHDAPFTILHHDMLVCGSFFCHTYQRMFSHKTNKQTLQCTWSWQSTVLVVKTLAELFADVWHKQGTAKKYCKYSYFTKLISSLFFFPFETFHQPHYAFTFIRVQPDCNNRWFSHLWLETFTEKPEWQTRDACRVKKDVLPWHYVKCGIISVLKLILLCNGD